MSGLSFSLGILLLIIWSGWSSGSTSSSWTCSCSRMFFNYFSFRFFISAYLIGLLSSIISFWVSSRLWFDLITDNFLKVYLSALSVFIFSFPRSICGVFSVWIFCCSFCFGTFLSLPLAAVRVVSPLLSF